MSNTHLLPVPSSGASGRRLTLPLCPPHPTSKCNCWQPLLQGACVEAGLTCCPSPADASAVGVPHRPCCLAAHCNLQLGASTQLDGPAAANAAPASDACTALSAAAASPPADDPAAAAFASVCIASAPAPALAPSAGLLPVPSTVVIAAPRSCKPCALPVAGRGRGELTALRGLLLAQKE